MREAYSNLALQIPCCSLFLAAFLAASFSGIDLDELDAKATGPPADT